MTPGTTYFWKVVAKTAASIREGSVWSFTTSGTATPPGVGATVVLWLSKVPAAGRHGNWTSVADATAAGGSALWNPNRGQSKISPALASPASYFEMTFAAESAMPYRLWVRLRAEGNARSNDSVHLQFSDSVDQFGSAVMRIGTTGSAECILQRGSGDPSVHGWGWTDDGWETIGPLVYFSRTGTHTVRVQQREDGAMIDQIVISPSAYYSSPPGVSDDDARILAATESAGGDAAGVALPTLWIARDIGVLSIQGPAGYANSTFTVAAAGADIWGTADAFHFVYRPLSGDGSIQARVASLQASTAGRRPG
jgi:hypothetical protein